MASRSFGTCVTRSRPLEEVGQPRRQRRPHARGRLDRVGELRRMGGREHDHRHRRIAAPGPRRVHADGGVRADDDAGRRQTAAIASRVSSSETRALSNSSRSRPSAPCDSAKPPPDDNSPISAATAAPSRS